ncbi:hypothetical protein Tco_0946876 [Tanacetum coccineum]
MINSSRMLASEQFSSGLELQLMTPGTISSGLAQNLSSSTAYVPPTKKYWDILFQPMFDEYFQPSPSVVSCVLLAEAPTPADTTSIPSSTSIDQDAPVTTGNFQNFKLLLYTLTFWVELDFLTFYGHIITITA